ncbi:Galactokinase [uncultured archaeon]|nr:Galactokinase [uncultured archaeon]
MIISKTPFRISFAGGLSDIKEYYEKDYGAVTSTTINKYIYITVNKKFDNKIRISYSKTEIVKNIKEITHPIIREALKLTKLDSGLEITSIGDVPSGTGLGSSSSFTVGLLNALYAFKGENKCAETLARQACKIEIDFLKEPIGKQDQYASAYGGLNHIRFNNDETVFVNPIICKKKTKEELNQNLLLFYVGGKRKASNILNESKKQMENHRKHVDTIRELSEEVAKALHNNDLSRFGELLHQGWMYKKKTGKVTNKKIDFYYQKAIKSGAAGGKILGAGAAGFLLLYCDKKNQYKVRNTLSNLKETPFNLEPQGSKIIYMEE